MPLHRPHPQCASRRLLAGARHLCRFTIRSMTPLINLTPDLKWDQSRFDALLKDYLQAHWSYEWPRILNKKAARLCWRILMETPFKEVNSIEPELLLDVYAKRSDGTAADAPVGYVMAAHRAARDWTSSARFRQAQQRMLRYGRSNELKAWRRHVKDKYKRLLGGRKASVRFIQVGWISVLQSMAAAGIPEARTRQIGTANLRGALKGYVRIAREGDFNVTMTNVARSRHEHSGQFYIKGTAAMQRAFDLEMADLEEYFRKEMAPKADEFNRKA